jgi:hypothetical protein
MRYITEGVNAIDKKISNKNDRNRVIVKIFNSISPEMASTEVEAKIEDIIDKY